MQPIKAGEWRMKMLCKVCYFSANFFNCLNLRLSFLSLFFSHPISILLVSIRWSFRRLVARVYTTTSDATIVAITTIPSWTHAINLAIMSSSNLAIMPSSNHAVIQSRNHASIQSSNNATTQSSNHAIIQSSNQAIIKLSNLQIMPPSNRAI